MISRQIVRKELKTAIRQRGVVLFFTLIALVVMSLAAVALIRSVDTSTMIAGNLAFKQSATTSGDGGIEAAVNWLATQQQIMTTAGQNVYADPGATLIFNQSNAANAALGYYSSFRSITDLTDGTVNWDATDSASAGTDASGNTIRYIIERMCSTPNQPPVAPNNCLYATPVSTLGDQAVLAADQVCQGAGCLQNSQSPQVRITARVAGPRNTYSYVQTFVY
jgi:type IV pilus assembly protein PilX